MEPGNENPAVCLGSTRYHIVRSLFSDLLGPKMGPDEVIENPFEQYTVGILKSIYKSAETEEETAVPVDPSDKIAAKQEKGMEDETDLGAGDDEERYLVDADLNPMQGARSLGLSFIVCGTDPRITVCCTWGRYENLDGLPRSVWKRLPNFFVETVGVGRDDVLDPGNAKYLVKGVSKPGVKIHVRASKIQTEENQWNVSIFLVNNTPFVERQQTEHYVFQPQIRVLCGSKTEIVPLGRTQPPTDSPDSNDELLFRNMNSKGRGHLCGVVWKEVDPECNAYRGTSFSDFAWADASSSKAPKVMRQFKKPDIRTEYLPVYAILQPDLSETISPFDASRIANMWEPSKIKALLETITDRYTEWISESAQSHLRDGRSDNMGGQAAKNLEGCRNMAKRINHGISLLLTDEKARLAFCFMNQVMSDKRKWDNRNKTKEEQSLKWHEFQMAFILQSLRGAIPGNDEDKQVCDILWFPTGGGKTEAYLGLMVFVFAYRRLLDLDSFHTDGGVSIISRYTLRLLTIQQFTRALGAVLAADIRRVQNWRPQSATFSDAYLNGRHKKGRLWGASRFSLGIWIGDLTPNKFAIQGTRSKDILNAEGALLPEHKIRKQHHRRGEPAQVTECPCCGAVLAVPPEKAAKPGQPVRITWIIKTDRTVTELESIPDSEFTGCQISLHSTGEPAKSFFELNTDGTDGTKYIGFTARFCSSSRLTGKRIDRWWKDHVKTALGHHGNDDPLQCTRASQPGYFFLYRDGENRPFDFALHCPNKNCDINKNAWFEEVTAGGIPAIAPPFRRSGASSQSVFPPISAFTVDEQVYSRCPTVVIATVDKFARLPFEPAASSLFGNVDFYNRWDGYGRGNPERGLAQTGVRRFLPPSLIIQDELHLIEGPLGSMVGLYEMAVDILSSSHQYVPKYIASTATIKEAESQVGTVYRRGVRIFPPQGISYGHNHFSAIDEDPSCLQEKPGRLHIGILAPQGTLRAPVKIWASVLSTVQRIRKNPERFGLDRKYEETGSQKTFEAFVDEETDGYWTLVGYFNALRELSIARSLYNADVLRDVRKWSSAEFSSITCRLGDTRVKSALRLVPVETKTGTTISAVSVFCKSRGGRLSVALYENDKARNTPGSLIDPMKGEHRTRESEGGENEFLLKRPLSVKANDMLWVAVFNHSDNTEFHSGRAGIKSRVINEVKTENGLAVFPPVPQNASETNTTIRVVLKTEPRELDPINVVELSSATESHELPEIIERLQEAPSAVDCLFTTSMFGTGIDIDRLGLMAVTGQPKSTSAYIQSTGRVGRRCPGLVITWLRAGRIRDLNHYENFVGYHRAIHRYVEPISAAPFSEEAMNLCMGPVSVAILRNARSILGEPVKTQWIKREARTASGNTGRSGHGLSGPLFMADHSDDGEILALKRALLKICNSDRIAKSRRRDSTEAEQIINRAIDKWKNTAKHLLRRDLSLEYEEYTMIKGAEKNVVLGTPQHRLAGKSVAYRNTRNSLRNVESTSTMGDSGWIPSS